MGEANKLFVGNLSFDTQTDDLRNEFEKYGTVQDCIVLTDRDTGRPRGFGFVTFSSQKEASQAEEATNGQEFMGRQLRVNAANSRGGGGGGGYRGGGGGYQGGGGGYGGGGGRY